MTYYLQDYPNPNFGQFGWPRKRVSGAIGVHTAENNTDFEGADPGAEDVARFLGRRTDPGSYHAIADADSRIKLIHPSYSAWADTTNNAHGMSVSGAMQAARWRELTPERAAALTRNMALAAADLVRDALAAGLLDSAPPARRITPAEAIAGSRAGFYGHGETNPGRRYDPGENFNWSLFLTTYANSIGGLAAMGTITTQASQEDDVSAEEVMTWPVQRTDGQKTRVIDVLAAVPTDLAKLDTILAVLGAMAPEVTESMINDRKQVHSLDGLWNAVANIPAPQIAAQIDAAGLASEVRDELVKLLEGK